MSYAHATCCAHLKIQYCKESLDGLTHDWWECASCKMLFAPQGRMPLPPYTPPAPGPTEKECDKIIALLSSESERDDELQGIRDWFADVTARIEREKQT